MAALQKPPYVFLNGELTRWDEARIHVSAEAVIRGISVFEGIKGYWDASASTFSLLALKRHYRRLCRSAEMLQLPFTMPYAEFASACATIVEAVLEPGKDLWLRPTILPVEGHWGIDTKTDLAITAYTQPMQRPEAIEVGVSSWQRPGDAAQPARIKCAANYTVGRNARIEGRRHGYGEMILLNQWGRISEATGSAVVIVRDGVLITPPASEACLESITIDIVEAICAHLDLPFQRRPVDRSELALVDEMCIAGTLAELAPVRRIEWRLLPAPGPLLGSVADVLWRIARREFALPGIELTSLADCRRLASAR
jgi:branched-chain amino acid aminotransferase